MNKKEIAQQYTRQMLEQEQSPKQELKSEHLHDLMKEIHRLHLKAQENYRNSSERQTTRLEQEYRTLLRLSQDLNFNLMRMEATIDNLYQKGNELPNFWVKRMYFNSILVGICSAIIVMVIVWIIAL